ncbi:MAG: alpha-galactosidase [Chloroflexi bacterium]|nr:alpha-galactosidase [Chloroflexota bacterium]
MSTPDAATQSADMALIRAWTDGLLANPQALPVTFMLDGVPLRGIPAAWRPRVSTRRVDANILERAYKGKDPASGLSLRVICTIYQDFPVVEWVAEVANRGAGKSPLISGLQALDAEFAGANAQLEHCNGDFYNAAGYAAELSPLAPDETLVYAPNGGRPSDGAFPYYRLMFAGKGLTLAIGWPGQWEASFSGTTHGAHIRAGQQLLSARLEPGEAIRTPRISLLAWEGDRERSINLWRRWYLAHILPRPDGRPLQPLLVGCAPGDGEEFTASTEANQVAWQDLHAQRGLSYDVWWIDAGWYPCWYTNHERKWWHTGDWRPDPERYPNGLKPVSAHLEQRGAKLLVWFEPERVHHDTRLEVEHPEWLLRVAKSDNRLLNLGDPACRRWLTDHVCKLIEDNGIRIYRQDFNFEPLDFWRANDAPDRQGMNENLHVQGYLQYWDDLLARNPGLWIDSCSSGGRRNDLETMRRSVPLHYTDFGYGEHPIKLAFHHRMHEWLPYFKEAALSWDQSGPVRYDAAIDPFSYYCAMAPMLFPTFDVRRDDLDYALAVKMAAIWRKAAPYILYGDYYALSVFEKRADQWLAWQFNSPESGAGFIEAVRLQQAPAAEWVIRPRGLEPDARYIFEHAETGEVRALSGCEALQQGLKVELPQRAGVIWFYKKACG